MDSKLLFIIASSFCILGSCLMYAISKAEERRKLRESEGNFNPPKHQKHQKGPEEEHITEDVKVETISVSTENKEESEKDDEAIVEDVHGRNGYRIVAIILFGISLLISVWLVPMILSQNRREKVFFPKESIAGNTDVTLVLICWCQTNIVFQIQRKEFV